MNGLSSKNRVDINQIASVPVPEHTHSWRPVPYMDAINEVKASVRNSLSYDVESEEYGLSKDGLQMFGVITLDTGARDQGLAIGLRQSYNRSLALGIAVGSQVFVCDNLMFSGDAFKVVRRNTLNVRADFQELLEAQIGSSETYFRRIKQESRTMKAVSVEVDQGFEILGRTVGHKVMTPTQATVAFDDWRNPRHSAFETRNLWSLYNCVTEGLKRGRPSTIMERYTAAHSFFTMEMIDG